jgi:hypothetical protein
MAEVTTNEVDINLDDWDNLGTTPEMVIPAEKIDTKFFKQEDHTSVLDEPVEEEHKTPDPATKTDEPVDLSVLDEEVTEEDAEEKKPGRAKTDKSALVKLLNKKIESGAFFAFDDYDESKETVEEYLNRQPEKDLEELVDENLRAVENKIRQEAPQQLFEVLPEKLKVAVKYALEGGSDIEGIFSVLGQVQKMNNLDPEKEEDQVHIVRSYLQAKEFGTSEEIEAEIGELKDLGKIEDKAKNFKPKLDKMQEEVVQAKLAQQEEANRQRQAAAQAYVKNVHDALKPGELNGLKLTTKDQNELFTGLTQLNYQSLSGQPTNEFAHLIEKYQFGPEADYSRIAEALFLLKDRERFMEAIEQRGKNKATEDHVRRLKTTQGKSGSSLPVIRTDDNTSKSTGKSKIQRPERNFFER